MSVQSFVVILSTAIDIFNFHGSVDTKKEMHQIHIHTTEQVKVSKPSDDFEI